MGWKALLIVLLMMPWPLRSEALTHDDFLVRTTQDYIKLCTASDSDPLYSAAIGFCHGYAVGAYQYYQATTPSAEQKGFVCFPTPPPTRVEALQRFLTWAKEHPQSLQERPVDSIFRFLEATFPCQS
jgi:hypothetical protein